MRKRAEDILDMVDKTTDEFKALDEITGELVLMGKSWVKGGNWLLVGLS